MFIFGINLRRFHYNDITNTQWNLLGINLRILNKFHDHYVRGHTAKIVIFFSVENGAKIESDLKKNENSVGESETN